MPCYQIVKKESFGFPFFMGLINTNMFIDSKYTKWYYLIIDNALERKKLVGIYTEKHHIIPKSLGGDNLSQNVVILTAREHILCHWLITKMCINAIHTNKMVYAFHSMGMKNEFTKNRHINSRAYHQNKLKYSELLSKRMKENNPMFDDNIRQKHLESIQARGPTKGTTGMKHSNETKLKMSKSAKGRKVSNTTKEKLSKIVSIYWEEQRKAGTDKRKPCSEEKKRKISESLKKRNAEKRRVKND